MNKIVQYLKTRAQNFKIKLKNTVQEAKEKPKSKRKSFILGFTFVLAIFGVALAVPTLSAVAKDIPKGPPKSPPGSVPSSKAFVLPAAKKPVAVTTKKISGELVVGVVAIICGGAAGAGSFAAGAVCGVVLLGGIIYNRFK